MVMASGSQALAESLVLSGIAQEGRCFGERGFFSHPTGVVLYFKGGRAMP